MNLTREPKTQRLIVLVVIIVTILFWLTTSVHGITDCRNFRDSNCGAYRYRRTYGNDDTKKLPWDTLFLVAGGLSLGEAIESTGILNHYANQLRTLNIGTTAFIFLFSVI